VFTFTIGNIKQLSFKLRLKVLRSSADLQLYIYDSEFQTEGALTLNAFADNASVIRGTVSNNLSDDRVIDQIGTTFGTN